MLSLSDPLHFHTVNIREKITSYRYDSEYDRKELCELINKISCFLPCFNTLQRQLIPLNSLKEKVLYAANYLSNNELYFCKWKNKYLLPIDVINHIIHLNENYNKKLLYQSSLTTNLFILNSLVNNKNNIKKKKLRNRLSFQNLNTIIKNKKLSVLQSCISTENSPRRGAQYKVTFSEDTHFNENNNSISKKSKNAHVKRYRTETKLPIYKTENDFHMS